MIKRLHHKFVIINMSIITIMMLIMVAVVLQMTKSGLERKSHDMMRQIAMNPIQPEIPEKDYSGVRLPYFVLEIDHTGEISVAGGDYYALSDAGFQQQVVDEVQKTDAKSGLLKQYGLRFFCVDTGQCERMVFADTSNEISTMNSLTGICIMIFLGGFIIFLCISSFLAKWAVYPAETAWIQQKQFVADASHELRTPLTIILTNTELMCSPECSEEEKDCLAQNILTVSQQMRGLIEKLLDLAQADRGAQKKKLNRINWSDTVNDAVLPFEAVFYEAELGLDVQIGEDIFVRGDDASMQQVAAIFLDNARKYAYPATEVRVVLEKCDKRHAVLSVANQGLPIDQTDLKNIFKRFYRSDTVRRRDGSYGLGLAIAQEIVEWHKGTIWAESEHGWNTFFIRLRVVKTENNTRGL
ncbi:sensor histidine kinase [Butyricicoccus sp.]|uniref:sensor histidine kinase n=1 Tax=Butyricicoccus sp. TaxID=2049021 RepID=UPI0037364480